MEQRKNRWKTVRRLEKCPWWQQGRQFLTVFLHLTRKTWRRRRNEDMAETERWTI